MSTLVLLLIWLAVAAVRTVSFPGAALSRYELQRRMAAGDREAEVALQREADRPLLLSLQRLVAGSLFVLAIAVTVALFGVLTGTLLSLAAILIIEPLSKTAFFQGPFNRLERRYHADIVLVSRRLRPLLRLIATPAGNAEHPAFASKEELAHQIEQTAGSGVLHRDEKLHLISALRFGGRQVTEIMTPRSVVETVEQSETVGPLLLDRLHKTGHSRFPVIAKDIDHVVGTLYLHELIDKDRQKDTVRAAMDPKAYFIRQDATLEHALHAFLRTHHHLFIVVNEFRETVGVISLEDVIEALLGRTIVDEFDAFDDLRAVAARNPRANNQSRTSEEV